MMVVLAIVVGVGLLAVVWRGTRVQSGMVRAAAIGAALVLSGALLIGSLLTVTDPGGNLVITEAALRTSQGGDRSVEGAVENRTDRDMSPVRLEIEFIDSQSKIIDRTTLETGRLDAGSQWDFSSPVKSEAVAGFRARAGSPDNVRPAWLGGGCGSDLCREN